ncbi:MAG TPA: SHOCT domain-containing protein [Dehalococcoidia bacterium]|nr:SHOCT domain-containing protein [Dehalococcoidia bacterium]
MRRRGPGLVGTMARTAVVAGTASAVSGRVHRRQQERWAGDAEQQAMQEQAMQQQAAPPPAAPPEQADYMAELQQLATLKQQGIITEEEFEAKKKQLLGI